MYCAHGAPRRFADPRNPVSVLDRMRPLPRARIRQPLRIHHL